MWTAKKTELKGKTEISGWGGGGGGEGPGGGGGGVQVNRNNLSE